MKTKVLVEAAVVIALMSFTLTAFAAPPSMETSKIGQQQTIKTEGFTKSAVITGQETRVAQISFATMVSSGASLIGKTIETAIIESAGKMETQKIEVQKASGEAQAPMEIVAAESVPKYNLSRTEGIAIATSQIWVLNNFADKDVGKIGGVIAWTNGGGPLAGSASMAIYTPKIQNMKTGTVVRI